jgi:hypothetical protein
LHQCGTIVIDDEGVDYETAEEARRAALRAAREIMAAGVVEGQLRLACHVEVRDEAGVVVLTVPFDTAVAIVSA